MSRYERDIDEYKRDIDVIWTPSPEKKLFGLFIYVYICLYLAAFVYITSTDMNRFEHTHISFISVHIAYARIYTDIDRYEHVWEICTISDVKMHSSVSWVVRAVAWHWKVLGSIPGAEMGIFDFLRSGQARLFWERI